MPDLAERIRTYVDTAQPPVRLEDVKSTVDQHQREGRRTRIEYRRRSLLTGALIGAAIVALVGVLVGIFGNGKGERHPRSLDLAMAPASVVLHSVATIADGQSPLVPGPGQSLHVRELGASITNGFASTRGSNSTEGQEGSWTYYEQFVRQTWTSPTGPNATSTSNVGVPQFLTKADEEAWKAAGSPSISTGAGGSLPNPYYDVTDLPTDPTKIAAYMANQPGLPASNLSSSAEGRFNEASQYLGAGASSRQRAALYSFMATLPGVVNYGPATTLGTGLSGVAIGIPGHDGERVAGCHRP